MLVEMYEKDGFWFFKDNHDVEWGASMPVAREGEVNAISPKEANSENQDKQRLKIVMKLKKEGFTTEEIIDLFETKVL